MNGGTISGDELIAEDLNYYFVNTAPTLRRDK